jgi:drug/metabolite transporter (DMT)-like permease
MDIKFLPLLGSEIALSLYPQLIKLIPTTIEVQVAVRCITYSILAIIGYYITTNNKTILSAKTDTTSSTNTFSLTSGIVMGIVNIIHIISSYMCFNILSSGVGYSIFYIYPIFNLLGRTLIYNEKINIINYIYIIIAIIGVYLIYKKNSNTVLEPLQNKNENNNEKQHENNLIDYIINNLNIKNNNIGLIAGIVSALTESIIYFMVKDDVVSASPFIQLLKTYLLGGILSIIYLIKNLNHINLDYHFWITIILFNTIVGFVGYLLRFIMIPRLSTLLFNSLIFVGVIFSYLWGYILSKEPITYNNLSGTALILMSILLINNK